jgi:hypothetical protein
MRIYLAVLGAFGVLGETFRSVLTEVTTSPHEWVVSPQYLQACIDRGRGITLTHFLDKSDADVLLSIDDDVVLPVGSLAYVAEQALALNALVGPIVCKRAFHEGYSCRLPADARAAVGDPTPIELGRGDWVGGTCYALPRAVAQALDTVRTYEGWIPSNLPFLRKVRHENGVFIPDEQGDRWEYVSEDAALTQRVQEAGFKAYALPKVDSLHVGKYAYKPEDALKDVGRTFHGIRFLYD